MTQKLLGIIVCMLLIGTTALPVLGTVNLSKNLLKEQQIVVEVTSDTNTPGNDVDWWPKFHHDLK